jgi:hypothetical protein
MEINRATEVNQEVTDAVKDMFEYHPWNEDQVGRGAWRKVLMTDPEYKVVLDTARDACGKIETEAYRRAAAASEGVPEGVQVSSIAALAKSFVDAIDAEKGGLTDA